MILAALHFAGAIVASFGLGVVTLAVAAWELGRSQDRLKEDMALVLGIPVSAVDRPEHDARVRQALAVRYSNERFGNRLSDLAGLLLSAWRVLAILCEVAIVAFVLWATYTGGATNAVLAWLLPVAILGFLIAEKVFNTVCMLLTARLPGEAKMSRQKLSEFSAVPASPEA